MLQSPTIRIPPSTVKSIVVQPRIDTDKPPAIISKKPTSDTDPIASTCALFWEGMRRWKRTERRNHLEQFLAGMRFDNEKRNARLRLIANCMNYPDIFVTDEHLGKIECCSRVPEAEFPLFYRKSAAPRGRVRCSHCSATRDAAIAVLKEERLVP